MEKYYRDVLAREGALLCSLIEPDKNFFEKGAAIARKAAEAGADAILIGGSIGAQGDILDNTVKLIKEAVDIPVVLFPGNISGLTQYADAVYFMHLLNSRDVYWLSTAQIQAAPVVARMGIEAIPTTYIVLEPGMAVGWVGNANLIPRGRPDLAMACALSARFTGSHVLIADSGSGAPSPAPPQVTSSIARACSGSELIFFSAGGVRTPLHGRQQIRAGAAGIQVGTAFEHGAIFTKMKRMVQAVKREGRKRV